MNGAAEYLLSIPAHIGIHCYTLAGGTCKETIRQTRERSLARRARQAVGGGWSSKAGWLQRTGTDAHQLLNSGVTAAVAVTDEFCGWPRSRKPQPWWICTYARADRLVMGVGVESRMRSPGGGRTGQDDGQGHKRKACRAGWRSSRCSVCIDAEEN